MAMTLGERHYERVAVILVVAALPLLAYGTLNVVTPSLTMRWQRAATSRRHDDDLRRQIGLGVQSIMGDSELRVRFIGAIEVAVAVALIGIALRL